MPDPIEPRIRQLERKLGILLSIAVVQTVLLVMILFNSFLPDLMWMIRIVVFVIVVGGFGFYFRHQIPGWFGQASRFVFSYLKDPDARS